MLTSLSVSALLDAFSSPDPTPGGGSASALAGALGASLLAMVAGMPKTKTGTPEARTALDEARARLLDLRATLVELVDRDAAAYELVVAAYRKPKTTDEEKAVRKTAIQDAMRIATEVPVETVRACTQVTHAAIAVAEYGNPSAASDIAVGLHLVGTARLGALFNVEINIGSLSDPQVVATITSDLQGLFRDGRREIAAAYEAGGVVDLMKRAAQRAGQLGPDGRHLS